MQSIMNRFNQLLSNFLLGGFFQITFFQLVMLGKNTVMAFSSEAKPISARETSLQAIISSF